MSTTISSGRGAHAVWGVMKRVRERGRGAAALLALAGVLGASACVEHRPRAASLDALDGGRVALGLTTPSVFWHAPGDLRVVVATENETSCSVSLAPSSFALRTADGALVPAVDAGIGGCAEGEWAAPGERVRCTLRFHTYDVPVALEHALGPIAIAVCGPEHRFGLCAHRELCLEGECLDQCSISHQDGACVDDNAVCDRGRCVSRCSEDPGSGCEEGRCVEGRCDLSCRSVAAIDLACADCAWNVIDAGDCEVEDRCRDCADCPGSREPGGVPRASCECLEGEACDGCADAASAYWACLIEACPVCGE